MVVLFTDISLNEYFLGVKQHIYTAHNMIEKKFKVYTRDKNKRVKISIDEAVLQRPITLTTV